MLTYLPRLDPFWEKTRDRYDILLGLRDLVLWALVLFYALSLYGSWTGLVYPYWQYRKHKDSVDWV